MKKKKIKNSQQIETFLPDAGFRVKIKTYSFFDFSRNDSFLGGYGIWKNVAFLSEKHFFDLLILEGFFIFFFFTGFFFSQRNLSGCIRLIPHFLRNDGDFQPAGQKFFCRLSPNV
jgi:hypothetical protein